MPPVHSTSAARRGACAVAALALSLLAPDPALAYVVRTTDSGAVVRWQEDEVHVRLDASLEALCGAATEGIMVEALSTWQDSGLLPTRIVLESGEGAQVGSSGPDDHNDIVAPAGAWPWSPSFSAVTVTVFDATTGSMLDADIAFDPSRPWSCAAAPGPGQIDLLDTATHEFGHLLGLADSDDPAATMYPEAVPGSVGRRSLDADDIEALAAAYETPPPLGRVPVGCAAAPAPARAPAADLLLGALALAAARRRGRRSRAGAQRPAAARE